MRQGASSLKASAFGFPPGLTYVLAAALLVSCYVVGCGSDPRESRIALLANAYTHESMLLGKCIQV